MKHILLALIAQAAVCSGLLAQTAITAGSGTAIVEGGYQFEFSIGEMSNVETVNISAPGQIKQITQGFLQPQATSGVKPRTASAPSFSLSVFPNPATDHIELGGNWASDDRALCKVLNAEGQLALTQEIVGSSANIQVAEFAPGVYYLTVDALGKTETIRFVKVQGF